MSNERSLARWTVSAREIVCFGVLGDDLNFLERKGVTRSVASGFYLVA